MTDNAQISRTHYKELKDGRKTNKNFNSYRNTCAYVFSLTNKHPKYKREHFGFINYKKSEHLWNIVMSLILV